MTSYAYETRPAFSTKTPAYLTSIIAEEIERRKFSTAAFQVWFDLPGVGVYDYTHEKARPGRPFNYHVAAPIEQFERTGGKVRVVLIGVNVAILVGIVCFLVRRWRRRAAA